jgi:hypothetical protein
MNIEISSTKEDEIVVAFDCIWEVLGGLPSKYQLLSMKLKEKEG